MSPSVQSKIDSLVDHFVPKEYHPCGTVANEGYIFFIKGVSREELTWHEQKFCQTAEGVRGLTLDYGKFIQNELFSLRFGIWVADDLPTLHLLFTILHEVGHVDQAAQRRVGKGLALPMDAETYADTFAYNVLASHFGHPTAHEILSECNNLLPIPGMSSGQ